MSKKTARQKDVNKPYESKVCLILDNIRSIYNIGAIFRTADGAGINHVYLCGISGYPDSKTIAHVDKKLINNSVTQATNGDIHINYTPTHECVKTFLLEKIRKTALVATDVVSWTYSNSATDTILTLKNAGFTVIGLEQSTKSIGYDKIDYSQYQKIVFVVGNEITGLAEDIINLCDLVVEIEMYGKGKSLNVATATGILIYNSTLTKRTPQ